MEKIICNDVYIKPRSEKRSVRDKSSAPINLSSLKLVMNREKIFMK